MDLCLAFYTFLPKTVSCCVKIKKKLQYIIYGIVSRVYVQSGRMGCILQCTLITRTGTSTSYEIVMCLEIKRP